MKQTLSTVLLTVKQTAALEVADDEARALLAAWQAGMPSDDGGGLLHDLCTAVHRHRGGAVVASGEAGVPDRRRDRTSARRRNHKLAKWGGGVTWVRN